MVNVSSATLQFLEYGLRIRLKIPFKEIPLLLPCGGYGHLSHLAFPQIYLFYYQSNFNSLYPLLIHYL